MPADAGDEFALRSTRGGGSWDFARDLKGNCPGKKSLFAYMGYGTEVERLLRERELLGMLNAAEEGRLTRGPGQDVSKVGRHSELLEMRFGHVTAIRGEDRPVRFRLYFAEPPQVEGLLLGLIFHKKAIHGMTDAQIRSEQNKSIDDAAALYKVWRTQQTM